MNKFQMSQRVQAECFPQNHMKMDVAGANTDVEFDEYED